MTVYMVIARKIRNDLSSYSSIATVNISVEGVFETPDEAENCIYELKAKFEEFAEKWAELRILPMEMGKPSSKEILNAMFGHAE